MQLAKTKLKKGMKKDPFLMQMLEAVRGYIDEGEKQHGERPKVLLDLSKDGSKCNIFVVRINPIDGSKNTCTLQTDAKFDLDLPQTT